MKIRVSEIKPGQTIRFEYGDYDNFVTGQVVSIQEDGRFMKMELKVYGKGQEARFCKSDIVEVVC